MSRGLVALSTMAVLGCTPTPPEVVDVYEGQTATDSGSSGGPGATSTMPGSTSSVADGSGGSGTGPGPAGSGGTTGDPLDPGTTGQSMGSTGPGSTTDPLGGSTGDGMPPSCDEVFDTAPGYELCSSDDTSCGFAVVTKGDSCTTICSSFGQACLGALDNPGQDGDACFVQGDYSCEATNKGFTICICSRP